MSRILVAEDTQSVREAISALLESEFHSVLTVDNGEDAQELFFRYHPELVVLDVMMPRKNGFDTCRSIRVVDKVTPIMFLSAKSCESDKVLGLGLGADDYVVKPFGSNEFLARVEALLRRAKVSAQVLSHKEFATFRLGNGIVQGKDLVFVNSKNARVGISRREYLLLRLLSLRQGEIVSKKEIMDMLWGERYLTQSRTLEQHLYYLRKKIEGNGFEITTIPRAGLRLQLTMKS